MKNSDFIAVYKDPQTNQVLVVYPATEELPLMEIFFRAVPKGVPFWVIPKSEAPFEASPEAWEIDETIPPDGFGEAE